MIYNPLHKSKNRIYKCLKCGAEIYLMRTGTGKCIAVEPDSVSDPYARTFDFNVHKAHWGNCTGNNRYREMVK